MIPKYDENVIVGIKYKNIFDWYIIPKNVLYLDLTKFAEKDYNEYIETNEYIFYRKYNEVLEENTISIFLENIKELKIESNSLKEKFSITPEEMQEDYYPVAYIDFDNKIFYSNYPEPINFEFYVPDSWEGKYYDFTKLIEEKNKYWE